MSRTLYKKKIRHLKPSGFLIYKESFNKLDKLIENFIKEVFYFASKQTLKDKRKIIDHLDIDHGFQKAKQSEESKELLYAVKRDISQKQEEYFKSQEEKLGELS
ncbi:MAG: hypothetical protein PHP82_03835 [Candidatus ainarchaeum sp.]|nr:hypothetical protein [Candidatus ainarchaeum sp.]